MTWERSWEYASWIIEAREKGAAFSFHGNVLNVDPRGGRLIDNLPGDACVEVRCAVKNDRIQPSAVGALPPQMAALCAANLAMFHLGAQAAIERRVETAVHALMLDPLSAAVCTPAQIRKMTLEMFAAEKRFLPGFR
jgi:alpha-galactosidase